ncbi:MAG TPA: asparaginase [Gemmatimonadaceae bacterium]
MNITHELDVVVTRGDAVESCHRVHAAIVDARDRTIGVAGDSSLVTFWRSCAKPFQIIPLLESGGFEAFGWGDEQLAVACASHGGEPEHVAIVDAMLQSLGLEEGDLACGPHEPLSPRGARILRECGARIRRAHNNCSGKHTAMLALALRKGWPIEGYERKDHEVQQAMLNQVALWSGVRTSQIPIAVDGCGVSVFALPLERMARAYSRLGAAAARGEEIPARITGAMGTYPLLVGGTDRLDSIIIEETGGRVITKVGAEGVHSALVVDSGIGLALKVEDGNIRAQQPALIHLLQQLDALPNPLPARLAELLRRPVRNTRGEIVGETYVRVAKKKRRGSLLAASN